MNRLVRRLLLLSWAAVHGCGGRTGLSIDAPETATGGASGAYPSGGAAGHGGSVAGSPGHGGSAAGSGGQGGQLPFACAPGTWDHDADPATPCVPWSDCVIGRHVVSPGTATSDRQCAPCPAGLSTTMLNARQCELVCQHGGTKVTLESGNQVCDCPAHNLGRVLRAAHAANCGGT